MTHSQTLHAGIVSGNSAHVAWNVFVAGVDPKPTTRADKWLGLWPVTSVTRGQRRDKQTHNLATI